jgi:cobalamin biosynthesis Mg chelatase CobN
MCDVLTGVAALICVVLLRRNLVARMLEAKGRGLWDASSDMLQRLQELYSDIDDQIEGVARK